MRHHCVATWTRGPLTHSWSASQTNNQRPYASPQSPLRAKTTVTAVHVSDVAFQRARTEAAQRLQHWHRSRVHQGLHLTTRVKWPLLATSHHWLLTCSAASRDKEHAHVSDTPSRTMTIYRCARCSTGEADRSMETLKTKIHSENRQGWKRFWCGLRHQSGALHGQRNFRGGETMGALPKGRAWHPSVRRALRGGRGLDILWGVAMDAGSFGLSWMTERLLLEQWIPCEMSHSLPVVCTAVLVQGIGPSALVCLLVTGSILDPPKSLTCHTAWRELRSESDTPRCFSESSWVAWRIYYHNSWSADRVQWWPLHDARGLRWEINLPEKGRRCVCRGWFLAILSRHPRRRVLWGRRRDQGRRLGTKSRR